MAREISSGETGGSRSYQLQSDDDSGKTALRLRRRHTALSGLYRSPPGLEASCTEPAASCTSRRLGMAGSGVRVARTSGRWKDPSALSALSAFVCLNDRGRQRRQGRQRFCGSGDLYRSRLSPQDCSSAGLGPAASKLLAWLPEELKRGERSHAGRSPPRLEASCTERPGDLFRTGPRVVQLESGIGSVMFRAPIRGIPDLPLCVDRITYRRLPRAR